MKFSEKFPNGATGNMGESSKIVLNSNGSGHIYVRDENSVDFHISWKDLTDIIFAVWKVRHDHDATYTFIRSNGEMLRVKFLKTPHSEYLIWFDNGKKGGGIRNYGHKTSGIIDFCTAVLSKMQQSSENSLRITTTTAEINIVAAEPR